MTQQEIEQRAATPLEASARLVHALDNADAFEHPVRQLRFIETHISWIVLTGDYAYKIKKPVDFGFLDFSTLEKRRHFCHEELRLNRRFAAQIYLDVVEIHGDPDSPGVRAESGADDDVLEYALRMVEFPQQCLLSHYASSGKLDAGLIDALALRIDRLHREADIASVESGYGRVDSVMHWSEENLQQLQDNIPVALMPPGFSQLRDWYRQQTDLPARLEQRRVDGHIRECHGDLHLDNIALIDHEIIPFDCIEFNSELRWIDTISEASFVAMDLQANAYSNLVWRFISRYLESSADYDAIALLRYYVIYRALVRAKVEVLKASAATTSDDSRYNSTFAYLTLAQQWAQPGKPGMILMHGLSGSGKSTVAAQLVAALGAIQLRSDVVRKQLFDLAAGADSGSSINRGIYSEAATSDTYRALRDIASKILAAGYIVIVDAAFLLRSQRQVLLELAETGEYPCVVVECDAPADELRKRILERRNDPSEADLEVLEQQFRKRQPVEASETGINGIVTTGAGGAGKAEIDRIRKMLSATTLVDGHQIGVDSVE